MTLPRVPEFSSLLHWRAIASCCACSTFCTPRVTLKNLSHRWSTKNSLYDTNQNLYQQYLTFQLMYFDWFGCRNFIQQKWNGYWRLHNFPKEIAPRLLAIYPKTFTPTNTAVAASESMPKTHPVHHLKNMHGHFRLIWCWWFEIGGLFSTRVRLPGGQGLLSQVQSDRPHYGHSFEANQLDPTYPWWVRQPTYDL